MIVTDTESICKAAAQLPANWRFTPVRGKRPYLNNWQDKTLTIPQLKHQLLANGATGFGLITGNGLLAIDVDGTEPHQRLTALAKEKGGLPKTVKWTSGKPDSYQVLYRVTETLHKALTTLKFAHKALITNSGKQLDFRYDRCQSVLPPSSHPDTSGYFYLVPPSHGVADAPEWLESFVLDLATGKHRAPAREPEYQPVNDTRTQRWGDRKAPGRIPTNPGLLARWNKLCIPTSHRTNAVLLEFSRLIKESGLTCEEALFAFRHFAPQIPGFVENASRQSKRDLLHGTWAERIITNWYKRDGYSGRVSKRDENLNERRSLAAIDRILKSLDHIGGIIHATATQMAEKIRTVATQIFGIAPSKKTLWKYKELWHPLESVAALFGAQPLEDLTEHRVELQKGVYDAQIPRDSIQYTPLPEIACSEVQTERKAATIPIPINRDVPF